MNDDNENVLIIAYNLFCTILIPAVIVLIGIWSLESESDAKLKSDKYRHLGMELAGVRTCKNGSKLYELIKYPDSTV